MIADPKPKEALFERCRVDKRWTAVGRCAIFVTGKSKKRQPRPASKGFARNRVKNPKRLVWDCHPLTQSLMVAHVFSPNPSNSCSHATKQLK